MSTFLSGVGVILSLELRQRVRGTAWYVLLGIFVALVAIVTFLLQVALGGYGQNDGGRAGNGIFSSIIYFVLLLGTLVAPALSGNAINGDRDAGTLATTQVTLISTWQIVIGKFFAAWITALAFLACGVPFLIYASFVGDLSASTILVSVLILAVELGVVAAIGVGLSGILSKPLFSIVATYLVVAALSIGTLIAFSLGGLAVQSTVTSSFSSGIRYDDDKGVPLECGAPVVSTSQVPRFDYFWGILVANPYVLLADAVPTELGPEGYPVDLFGSIKVGVRTVQIPPDLNTIYNECEDAASGFTSQLGPTPREILNSTVPAWFVGFAIHLVLAAGALVGAWARTRTPAGRLAKGTRIA